MFRFVIASRNKKKILELRTLLWQELGKEAIVLSLDDIAYYDDIEENGKSFEENAKIKASAVAELGYIGIADDSGLCVEALKGAPGIYSARYSGGDDEDNNDLLLKELDGKENRNAKYVCAIACVFPDHKNDFIVRGECFGKILTERHGKGGFGYDPLFYYEPFGQTFAEVDIAKKHEVSHRSIAIKQLVKKLKQVLL